jgi:hypothetical protein
MPANRQESRPNWLMRHRRRLNAPNVCVSGAASLDGRLPRRPGDVGQLRVEMAVRPGEEVGYIVTETVGIRTDGQPTLTVRSGDSFLMAPRMTHNARDIGFATGQVICTCVVSRASK